MSITKSTVKVTNISELSTRPNATDGLTDATFKALFDKAAADNKDYINDVLTVEVDSLLSAKQKSITSGTAAPSGGSDGDIYIQYE